MTEIAASAVLTPGDTPLAVVIRPKTTHGCRPISVKIQPNELAEDRRHRESEREPAEPRGSGVRPLW